MLPEQGLTEAAPAGLGVELPQWRENAIFDLHHFRHSVRQLVSML